MLLPPGLRHQIKEIKQYQIVSSYFFEQMGFDVAGFWPV